MKRRDFLKTTSVGSIPLLLGGWQVQALARSPLLNMIGENNDKVLVLIQLNGGNDGLNTLIPLDQYDRLAEVRPNILLPEDQLIPMEQNLAMHPAMQSIRDVYDKGKFQIIQGVAYPNQNRSHFRSTDIWTSGSSSEEEIPTGWLGRYFHNDHPEYPEDYPNADHPDPFAITIGPLVSETCQGPVTNYSLALLDPSLLSPLAEGYGENIPDDCYGDELVFLREVVRQTNAYSDSITDAIEAGTNTVAYPDENNLAQQLKTVANLISGGLQTKVYVVSIGGFDTHAAQVEPDDPSTGIHAELLQSLSDAVQLFQSDLETQQLDERVLGMTFSEFGRQIKANFSDGTDHGTAAPMFVFGSCVEPTITGNNASIPDEVEPQEGVAMQYDFRSVYGSVLMDWFGLEEDVVRSLLYQEFQHLPIIRGCAPTAITEAEGRLKESLHLFPNPCNRRFYVEFETGEHPMRITLFDAIGYRHRSLTIDRPSGTNHRVEIKVEELPSGFYTLRLSDRYAQATARVHIIH